MQIVKIVEHTNYPIGRIFARNFVKNTVREDDGRVFFDLAFVIDVISLGADYMFKSKT